MGWKDRLKSREAVVLLLMFVMRTRRRLLVSSDGLGLRSPRVRIMKAVLTAEKRPAFVGGT